MTPYIRRGKPGFLEWLKAEKAAGHLEGAHSFTITLADGTVIRAREGDRRKGERRATP